MLNNELLGSEKEIEIAKLKIELERKNKAIEEFKAYDKERKLYYAKSMQRLGELESFVDELENTNDTEDLNEKLFRYKQRLSYLECLVQAKKIQENMTMDEVKALIKNKTYKEKTWEYQKRITKLCKTISELTTENEKLKNELNKLKENEN